METSTPFGEQPDLHKLLEENLKLTREVHASVAKIRRYLRWQRLVSYIYLLVIMGPLIIAAIYLPPLIKPLLQQYQALSDTFPTTGQPTSGLPNLQNLNPQTLQELLNQAVSSGRGILTPP